MHSIQISEKLGVLISDLAHRTHRSKNFYIAQALERLLEDEEDYQLALEAIAEGGPNIPWEEARKQLGLSDDK